MAETQVNPRNVVKVINASEEEEGEGARVARTIGTRSLPDLDPFLLLDEFYVKPPAGFPDHPHRGFETVTYMLDGKFKHRDNKGNEGVISPGGIQWMTAGRGIVHSEMPATDGVNHGLQLWVNLSSANKMVDPKYQDREASQIPVATAEGISVRIIAGESLGTHSDVFTRTPAMYLDISMEPNATLTQKVPKGWNGFCYVLQGSGTFGSAANPTKGETKQLLLLTDGDELTVKANQSASSTGGLRFVLIAGQPLNEPVAKYGPFVMNTEAEIMKAFIDFQTGKF